MPVELRFDRRVYRLLVGPFDLVGPALEVVRHAMSCIVVAAVCEAGKPQCGIIA